MSAEICAGCDGPSHDMGDKRCRARQPFWVDGRGTAVWGICRCHPSESVRVVDVADLPALRDLDAPRTWIA